MVLVALNDPLETYWARAESVRYITEMTWAYRFDLLADALRISGADDDLLELVLDQMPATLGRDQKAMMLSGLAAGSQRHSDSESAQRAFGEAIATAAWVGQAAVVRVCTRCVDILGARENYELLLRVHDELFNQGTNMSVFDQRGQHVTYQYNAAGDINLNEVRDRSEFANQLGRLEEEVAKAQSAGAIAAEPAADAQYNLKKAALEASKPAADKNKLVDHLSTVKTVVQGVAAAGGLLGAVTKAIELAQKLF